MASNLARFIPGNRLRTMDPLQNVDEFLNMFDFMRPRRGLDAEPIRMDVKETEQAYLVKAELPGFKKEDVKVAIDGDQITISANTTEEAEKEEGGGVWRERYHGQYYRRFSLPHTIDEAMANATCHDGILELTLPKKAGSGPRQLTIQ